ncbi:MAG: hypothetical protein KAI40_03490 [Desulfobacterales bacterium]|nr:hypothetical protein [Desulfobacterales bacterium]
MKNRQTINISIKFVTYIFSILILSSIPGFSSEKYKDFLQLDDQTLTQKIPELETFLKTDSDNTKLLELLGRAYHHLAREDKGKYASKALETLTKGYDLNKQDNIVLCYLGSATTMMAETTWNPMKKMSFVNKGVGFMDKAVKRDPDIIKIRLTRGYNSLSLPGFLKRKSLATTDFEYLAELIETHPDRYSSLKEEVYNNLIKIYKEDGNSEKVSFYSDKLKKQ